MLAVCKNTQTIDYRVMIFFFIAMRFMEWLNALIAKFLWALEWRFLTVNTTHILDVLFISDVVSLLFVSPGGTAPLKSAESYF